jgi:hypothetical protein
LVTIAAMPGVELGRPFRDLRERGARIVAATAALAQRFGASRQRRSVSRNAAPSLLSVAAMSRRCHPPTST